MEATVSEQPPWRVLLIAGASGVGKTQVSYRLARHYRVGLTEVDDFQIILERMTTPEQYPAIHLFRTDPDAFFRMDDEGKLNHAISYATTMAIGLEAVIANHIKDGPSIVLEGDFILPSLATLPEYAGVPADDMVRAIVIGEDDEAQINRNFLEREGEPQPVRAHASWRHNAWLRQEAERLGIPVVSARPWETLLARAIAAVDLRIGE